MQEHLVYHHDSMIVSTKIKSHKYPKKIVFDIEILL